MVKRRNFLFWSDGQKKITFLVNMLSLYYHFQICDRIYNDKLVVEDNNKMKLQITTTKNRKENTI